MKIEFEATPVIEFVSFKDWVRTAKRKFSKYSFVKTVAVDRAGNVLSDGAGFKAAEDNNNFPVVVYVLKELSRFHTMNFPADGIAYHTKR